MNILIVGGGGREHALAWQVAKQESVKQVYVAPGNAGTCSEAKVSNLPIAVDCITELAAFAKEHSIDLTIVGPEQPLALGIVDTFNQAGLPCFGPSRLAAQLESSKVFAKAFLKRHHIPTANSETFTTLDDALAYLRCQTFPLVIKADGLAAGKGVVIVNHLAEAEAALQQILEKKCFGQAGDRVIIEEFLAGEEASFIVVVDGKTALPLASSQDHKARDNQDRGPNTGGMGAYSPAPVMTEALTRRVMDEVILPTMRGMEQEGSPYVGFLYAGLMITPQGDPKVLEFNCRLGDPETQAIMLRFKGDLVSLCLAALAGDLEHYLEADLWDNRPALGVVMAAGGYPESYQKGYVIHGLTGVDHPDVKIFHAGTAIEQDHVVTAGGRVLNVCALGETVALAQAQAYEAVHQIHWDGAYYRTDIGYRAINRL